MTDCKPILREPYAWLAETGTAGSEDGCNRPFWLKHEAVAYVREHGGYVAPLFRSHSCDPADPCSTAYDLASERNTLDGLWAETKDRLDAALAQVARLREATLHAAAWFDAMAIEHDLEDRKGSAGIARQRAQICRAALAETAAEFAPGHTDMMVPPETLDAFMAANPLPPEPASDGWTTWKGGECPVADGTVVEVRCADGWNPVAEYAQAFDWAADADYPIVAYRIVEARDADVPTR